MARVRQGHLRQGAGPFCERLNLSHRLRLTGQIVFERLHVDAGRRIARAVHQVFQLFPCNFAAFIESSVTSVLFQQFFQQENPSFLHPAGDSFFSYFNPAGSSLQGHSPLNPYVYIEFLYIFYLRNTTYIALFLRVSSPILCEFYAISHRVHSSLTQEFLLKYSKCYILNYIS